MRLLLVALFCFTQLSWADYVEVRRNAYVYEESNRNSQQRDHIIVANEPNVTLTVAQDTLENGYHNVLLRSGQGAGWIYKTLVRRFAGNPPGPPPPVVALTGETMTAHFIAVGQGDATLLEFPCGAILIDAGAGDQSEVTNLVTYLTEFFARRTDLNNTLSSIIITHNHVDHTRALREVSEAFTVQRFIENGQRGGFAPGDADVIWLRNNSQTRNITVLEVDDNLVISQDGFTNGLIDPVACQNTNPRIRMLSADVLQNPGWPRDDFDNNKNYHSIVIRVDYGQSSFLFTGDLEEHAIETMVDYYSGSDTLDVDVYQVGHHGSYNGTTDSLLTAMTPEISVFSMSRWNHRQLFTAWAYGHPRQVVVDQLRAAISRSRTPRNVYVAQGVRNFRRTTMRDAIYGTGWGGTVRITADATGQLSVD